MMTTSMVPLGDLMARRLGSLDPAKFPGEQFDLYSIPAFDSRIPETPFGSEIGSVKQLVSTDDVLLSKIVPHIRRSWVVGKNRGRRIIASGEWIVFRSEHVFPNYLKHVLLSDAFHVQFMRTVSGVGGSLLRARPAQVAQIEIPLPPLEEQRRIAAILDKADELRAKRKEALTLLDSMAQSIFVDIFGDPATNPKGWQKGTIGDLLVSASYGTSEKSMPDGAVPVLRMNNITRTGELDLSDLKFMNLSESDEERYLARDGDILFNRTNSAELVGKTALFRHDTPMAYAGYLIRLRVSEGNNPEYLAGFLNTPYAKKVLRGMCKSIIGMANINATEIQAMKIGHPPLKIQTEYAVRIGGLRKAKVLHRQMLAKLDALFASLQYHAFRGTL